ncbi:MAG: hypothetical protein KF810_11615 [Rhizobiaceae bacterium]|nr:hypothetical protein [Rhizobiaceae bacterium]
MTASNLVDPLPQCPDLPLIRLYETVECGFVSEAGKYTDAIHMAAQLGRLDAVTTLIAVIGLALALGAFGWGAVVWRHASAIARETAEKETENYVKSYLSDDGEAILARHLVEWLGNAENRDIFYPSSGSAETLQEMFREADTPDNGGEDG